MKVKSEREAAQSCQTVSMDGSLPGSSIHGIFQARVQEWGAIAFSMHAFSSVAQSCPTLSDPMNCNLPGSSFHGIFQARVQEWGAIAFSIDELNYPELDFRSFLIQGANARP